MEEDQIEKSTEPYNYCDRIIRRDYNNVLENKKACLSWLQSCTTDLPSPWIEVLRLVEKS